MASNEVEDIADQLGGVRLDTEVTPAITDINSTKDSKETKDKRPKKHAGNKKDGRVQRTHTPSHQVKQASCKVSRP